MATGRGSGATRTDPASEATKVSPVTVSASLAATPMSPATSSGTSICSLPRWMKRWPSRSVVARCTLYGLASGVSVPDSTFMNDSRPTNGSAVVLNTCASSGPSGSVTTLPSSSVCSRPSGEGSSCTMRSSSCFTPTLPVALTGSTGTTSPAATAAASAAES